MSDPRARMVPVTTLLGGPLVLTLGAATAAIGFGITRSGSVWTHWLGLACSLIVGGVLLVAGATKIADRTLWARQAAVIGVPTPLVVLVPVSEMFLGALEVVGIGWPIIPLAAAGLLAAFTGVIAAKLSVGSRPQCACFGGWSARPIAALDLWRNAGLISLALLSLLR